MDLIDGASVYNSVEPSSEVDVLASDQSLPSYNPALFSHSDAVEKQRELSNTV